MHTPTPIEEEIKPLIRTSIENGVDLVIKGTNAEGATQIVRITYDELNKAEGGPLSPEEWYAFHAYKTLEKELGDVVKIENHHIT